MTSSSEKILAGNFLNEAILTKVRFLSENDSLQKLVLQVKILQIEIR